MIDDSSIPAPWIFTMFECGLILALLGVISMISCCSVTARAALSIVLSVVLTTSLRVVALGT